MDWRICWKIGSKSEVDGTPPRICSNSDINSGIASGDTVWKPPGLVPVNPPPSPSLSLLAIVILLYKIDKRSEEEPKSPSFRQNSGIRQTLHSHQQPTGLE